MKIVFAGDFRWNSGSSHTIYNYHRVAQVFNCEIQISRQYGSLDNSVGQFIPICHDVRWADHLVLVFESNQYLAESQLEELQTVFDRSQITIVDPDGRYGPTVERLGDSNHAPYPARSWKKLYDELSGRILQPCLDQLPPGVSFFPYFGMEETLATESQMKDYTIQYVGNNWYRWGAVRQFLDQLRPIRPQLGRIALKGKWWDGTVRPGFESATAADSQFLHELNIETEFSVPFGTVIATMNNAWISPIFVRPMIAAAQLLTPRMFETICADTIPIWSRDAQYIGKLYGAEASHLCYGDLDSQLRALLADRSAYLHLAAEIRRRLFDRFGYRIVFSELLRLLDQ